MVYEEFPNRFLFLTNLNNMKSDYISSAAEVLQMVYSNDTEKKQSFANECIHLTTFSSEHIY